MTNPFRKSSSDTRSEEQIPTIDHASYEKEPQTIGYDLSKAQSKGSNFSDADSFRNADPRSAFYDHPCTRSSLERTRAEGQTRPVPVLITAESNDPDLEAATTSASLPPYPSALEELESQDSNNHSWNQHIRNKSGDVKIHTTILTVPIEESSVWPSRETLRAEAKAKRKEEKRRRVCDPLQKLPRKQRRVVQLLLVSLTIGGAVGIGIGISQAVGGTTYAGDGQSKQIPD